MLTELRDPTGHYTRMPIIENQQCRLNVADAIRHYECCFCLHIWSPKAIGQDRYPNPQCVHGNSRMQVKNI